MCFFMLLYLVRKFKKIRKLTPYLSKKLWFYMTCFGIATLVSLFRSYLLGLLVYLILCYLFFDLLGFLVKRINKAWYEIYLRYYGQGIGIIIVAIGISVLSMAHVKQIDIINYTIDLDKEFQDNVRIMLVTDLHLGTATNEDTLALITNTAHKEQPDYLVLGGDIFDESSSDELMQAAYDSFSKLSQEVPIIYILGNHEYIANLKGEVVLKMEQAGVTVLEDEVMLAKEGFYFIGRTDQYHSMRSNKKRASLAELLQGLDLTYPVICLDHQPVELEQARDLGIDIVLSGHTHAGQFFPATFFAQFFNERLYGLEKDKSLYTVVSSGIGVWGMAMRNASNSEIVILDLK